MPIFVRDNCFVLETPHTHYAFGVADGELQHIHWGEKCPRLDYTVPNYREEVSQHPASNLTSGNMCRSAVRIIGNVR